MAKKILLLSVWRFVDHPSPSWPTCSCFFVLSFTLTLLSSAAADIYSTQPTITLPVDVNNSSVKTALQPSTRQEPLSFSSSSWDSNYHILSSLVDFLWSSNHSHSIAPSGGTFEDDLAEFVSLYQQNTSSPSSTIKVTPSVSVSMSTSTRIFTRSSSTSSSSSNQRKRERQEPGFQDIISGLVKLLGGKNVHVANQTEDEASGNSDSPLVTPPVRLNHRAPPKYTYFTNAAGSTTSSLRETTATPSTDNDQLSTSFLSTESVPETFSHSTTSTETELLPSGPITEWVPAYKASSTEEGIPARHSFTFISSTKRHSSTSTSKFQPLTHLSLTKVHTSSITTQPSSINIQSSIKTQISTKPQILSTKTQPSSLKTQLSSISSSKPWTYPTTQTEVDYAAITTYKPSPSTIRLRPSTSTTSRTKLATSQHTSAAKPTPILPTSITNRHTVIKTATSQPSQSVSPSILNIQPTTASRSSLTNVVGPTGSPFVIPVDIEQIRLMGGSEPESPNSGSPQISDQSVYIDGRKTYFDLTPTQTSISGRPGGDTTLVNVGVGYSFPIANNENENQNKDNGQGNRPVHQGSVSNIRLKQSEWPPPQRPLPSAPKTSSNGRPLLINKNQVRIDTCIIGDESACNGELNETCRVEYGVSSCYCRLGFGRIESQQQPTGCQPVVSLVVFIRVDRIGNDVLTFGPEYQNPSSQKYQILESESKSALDSAFHMSSLTDIYSASAVNSFFSVGTKLMLNATVHLLAKQSDVTDVPRQIRQSLIRVFQQHQQAFGQSRLYVDGPLNPIPGVQDLDECSDETLNDCSKFATCVNNFGSFSCTCFRGYMDKYAENPEKSGRNCAVCSPLYCNNRGDCIITAAGDKECRCHGNFIGAKCETDAEVLGVALGASLAALVIIILTLVCLCMWSRRWKREQQKVLGIGSSSYSYFNKPPSNNISDRSHLNCSPDFHHSSAVDHLRRASPNDISHDNYYAQPDSIMVKQQCYRAPPLPSCPPPQLPPMKHGLHPPLQPLRSLPSPLTNSRSNIMDDTDEDFEQMTPNYERFQFPKPPKSNRMIINPINTSNIYYDVNFSNNFKGGSSQHEFPMKNLRPFYS